MKRFFKHISCIYLLVSISSFALAQNSYLGKEFWFGYMDNNENINFPYADELKVYVSAEEFTTGKISVPGHNYFQYFSVNANSTIVLNIPILIAEHLNTEVKDDKAVLLETFGNVTVSTLNYQNLSSDKTPVLPTNMLGNEYVISSYKGFLFNVNSEFLVIATENNTLIEIIPSVNTKAGKPANTLFTILLNKGESYQLKGADLTDLTGSIIRVNENSGSCKPIAVFSGAECARIPVNCTACDHLFAQCKPTSTWGNEYIVLPFEGVTQFMYRVLAIENNTTVYINNTTTVNLNKGTYYEVGGLNTAAYITSDKPIQVVQYMQGVTCSGDGDPSMMVLNSNNQFANNLQFTVENTAVVNKHFINIIVKSTDISNVFLDDVNLNSSFFTPLATHLNYATAKIPILPGNHFLTSENGLLGYNYGMGSQESYAYSIGANLNHKVSFENKICTSNSATLVAPNSITTKFWYFENSSTDTLSISDSLILPSTFSSGVYTLVGVNKTSGCEEKMDFLVENATPINAEMIASSTTNCRGDEVFLSIKPNASSFHYNWNISSQNISNIRFKPTSSLWVKCTISTLSGCAAGADSVFINVVESNIMNLETSLNRNSICEGDTTFFNAAILKSLLFDNANTTFSLWKNAIGIVSNTTFGSIEGNSFLFNGSFNRVLESNNFNLLNGGEISFNIRTHDITGVFDTPENDETILLEYSTNSGSTWKSFKTFYPYLYSEFTNIEIPIPDSLKLSQISFRWIQPVFTGTNFDVWALDDIAIGTYNSSGFSFDWKPNAFITNNTVLNPKAFPITSQEYYLTVTDLINKCAILDTFFISVGSKFTLNTSQDTILCDVEGIELFSHPSIAGTYTYFWSPYELISNPYIENPIAMNSVPTEFIVEVVSEFGCKKIDTVQVDVTALINLQVQVSEKDICKGDSVTFLSEIKGTFLEDDFDPLQDPTKWIKIEGVESTLCGAASGNAMYFNGEANRYAETIDLNTFGGGFVNFKLKIGTLGIPCENSDVGEEVVLEFSVDGGNFFQQMAIFSTDNFPFFNSVSIPIPSGAQAATTRFRWRQVSWTAEDFDNWALDDVLILSGGNKDDFKVEWSPSSFVNNDSIYNPIGYPSTPTNFQLKLTDPSGCVLTENIFINVGSHFSLISTNDTLLCSADGTIISTSTNSITSVTYNWSPSNLLNNATLQNPTIFPKDTTLFTVTVTSDSGCTEMDSVLVFVPKPIFLKIESEKNNLCIGDSLLLKAQTEDIIIDSFSNTTIIPKNWSKILGGTINSDCGSVTGNALYFSGTTSRIAQTNTINTTTGGIISFSIKFGNSTFPCDNPELGEDVVLEFSINSGITWNTILTLKEYNYANFTAINIPIPIAAQALNTSFRWRQVSFTGNEDNWAIDNVNIKSGTNNPFYKYAWSSTPSSFVSDTSKSTVLIKPTERTSYSISVSDTSTGCSVVKEIEIKAGIYFNTNKSNDTIKCDTNSISLFVNNNYIGSTSVLWSPSSLVDNANANSTLSNPLTSTLYRISTTSDSGCIVLDSVFITVFPSINSNATATDTGLCRNNNTTLLSNTSGGIGTLKYHWTPNLFLENDTLKNTISSTKNSMWYYLTVVDSVSNCSIKDSVHLSVGPDFNSTISTDTLVCSNDSIKLHVIHNFSSTVTYEWQPSFRMDNNTLSNPTVSVEDTTTFYVQVISDSGCIKKDSVQVFLPNHFNIGITNQTSSPSCMGGNVVLIADENITDCNEYEIKTVPFKKILGTGTSILLGNDNIAFPENIGFDFRFFCNYYAQFYLSSNGFITFSPNQYHGCCTGGLLPSNTQPNNLIAFAWSNLSPLVAGTVNFFTTGITPNRIFVLNVIGVVHSTGNNPITTQIQLYETTNEIQIHTTTMLHNGTPHTMGIENYDGTLFYAPLGKNASLWNATNEGISFKPKYVPSSVSYTWEPNQFVSVSGKKATVNPNNDSYFYVNALDSKSGCIFSDSIYLDVDTTFNIKTTNDTLLCTTNQFKLSALASIAGVSYNWQPSNILIGATSNNPTININASTLFSVIATQSSTGCKSYAEVFVERKKLDSLTISPDTMLCKGDFIGLRASGGSNYSWFPKTNLFNDYTATPLINPKKDEIYTVKSIDSIGCIVEASVSIKVDSLQNLNLGNNLSLCDNVSITFDAGSGFTSYLWQNSSTIRTFTADTIGLYFVETQNACGVFYDSISILSLLNSNSFTLGKDTQYCINDTIFIGTTIPNVNYRWNTGATSPFIIPTNGKYVLEITNSNNCKTKDTIVVTTNPLPQLITTDTSICKGDSIQINVGGAQNYQWLSNEFINNFQSATPLVFPNKNYTFYVEGTDSLGCKNMDSVFVLFDSIPSNFLTKTLFTCFEESIKISSNTNFDNYKWNTLETTKEIIVNKKGTYWLVVDTKCGVGLDSTEVKYYPYELPKIDSIFYLCNQENTVVLFENTQGFDSLFWKNGDDVFIKNENEIILPKGVYSLYGTDKYNCVLFSTFTVTDGLGEIKVPNIFTPNADEINDEFKLIEYACVQNFSIRIFNRWGKQVYESNLVDFEWNGKSTPDGIYYYEIILTNSFNQEKNIKGWLQISR